MQLGIGTFTYGWTLSPEGVRMMNKQPEDWLLEETKRQGLQVLQIGDNLSLLEFDDDRLSKFSRSIAASGIQLQLGARGLTDDHLKQHILLCSRLEARLLRFVIDGKDYFPGEKELEAIIKKNLSLLKRHRVVLAIENHDRQSSSFLVELMARINNPLVGICLDTVNSIGAGELPDQTISMLAPFTVNLHIKDFGIERLFHKQGFIIQGRIAGRGLLDIRRLVQLVSCNSRCSTAILEQWVVPENLLADTIYKEKEWADQSVVHLKSFFT